ncbi:hypothetical protein [Mesorhizobium sp. BR1-1-2]|uniref:hypothetical protein n=1 Tax=Mesorhizobium sp. BR1-1-2 TaxID=2876652 RepID=UPI001CCDA2D8|nr:hypothetical protein [Mesorhizobium sp. BR1-1-2]MBZ9965906.1 hypothetical protein [Mesorhizobium sp. BR1-1-2]
MKLFLDAPDAAALKVAAEVKWRRRAANDRPAPLETNAGASIHDIPKCAFLRLKCPEDRTAIHDLPAALIGETNDEAIGCHQADLVQARSVRQASVMVDDRIENRIVNADSIFLDFGGARSPRHFAGERGPIEGSIFSRRRWLRLLGARTIRRQ